MSTIRHPKPASPDLIWDIQRGLYPYTDVVTVRGKNPDIDASAEDVIPWGGDYSFQTSAVSMEAVSTNANDDGSPAGTGARTLYVEGLDTNYDVQTETVTLNGVSAVTLANTYRRINYVEIATAGSGLVAAGDVSVQVASGGAVQARIPSGESVGRQGVYTVPAGYRVYPFRVVACLQKSAAEDVAIILRTRDLSAADQPFLSAGELVLQGAGTSTLVFDPGREPIDGPCDIIARVTEASANNNIVIIRIDLIREEL